MTLRPMRRRLGAKMQKLLELLEAGWVLFQVRHRGRATTYARLPHSDQKDIRVDLITIVRCLNAKLIIDDAVFGYIISGKPWRQGYYTVELETP